MDQWDELARATRNAKKASGIPEEKLKEHYAAMDAFKDDYLAVLKKHYVALNKREMKPMVDGALDEEDFRPIMSMCQSFIGTTGRIHPREMIALYCEFIVSNALVAELAGPTAEMLFRLALNLRDHADQTETPTKAN